jgi:methionyl aminopeptidase
MVNPSCRTFLVGEVAPETQKLVAVTKEALHKGISVCKPNTEFKEIGKAIDDYVSSQGFVVNLDFIGHGVGKHFHALPWVFPWRNSHRGRMQLGQTFTIEPAVHFKNCRHWLWKDGWTAVAVDGLPSAQFEHTVLITEGGVEILTACEE